MRTKIASMKYLLCFIAAVMMFGSSGIVASTLPLSAFEVCLMRLIIGALSMGLIFVVTRQRLPRHVGRRQYLFVALSGACLGLAMMTIFAAYRLLGVGLGAVLAATAPVITMALSPLLFKERLRIPVMVGFAIVVGGLLLLNASALEGTLSVPGILMGLAAAASTAGMVIFNKLARDITGVPCTTIQLATAVAVALAVAAAGEGFAFIGRIPSSSWPTVIALGARVHRPGLLPLLPGHRPAAHADRVGVRLRRAAHGRGAGGARARRGDDARAARRRLLHHRRRAARRGAREAAGCPATPDAPRLRAPRARPASRPAPRGLGLTRHHRASRDKLSSF